MIVVFVVPPQETLPLGRISIEVEGQTAGKKLVKRAPLSSLPSTRHDALNKAAPPGRTAVFSQRSAGLQADEDACVLKDLQPVCRRLSDARQ